MCGVGLHLRDDARIVGRIILGDRDIGGATFPIDVGADYQPAVRFRPGRVVVVLPAELVVEGAVAGQGAFGEVGQEMLPVLDLKGMKV